MGSASSTPSGSPRESKALDPAAVQNFLSYLRKKGRYYTVKRPDGRVVHILAVVPGSQASCREAKGLIRAIRPDTVYLDTFVSRLPGLVTQARRGGRPKQTVPPSVDVRLDYGIALSTVIHKTECDNGIFALLGMDPDDVFRTGLAEALAQNGCRVLAWPAHFAKDYENNLAAYDRFGDISFNVYGNMGFWSNQLYLIALVELTEAKILDGITNELGRVTIPPAGYFTTTAMSRIVRQHQQAFDAFAKRNSAESVDFESLLAAQIASFRSRVASGAPAVEAAEAKNRQVSVAETLSADEAEKAVTQMEVARELFHVQTQTLAGVLMGDDELAELTDDVMERDGGLGLSTKKPWPTQAATSDSSEAGLDLTPETVALVQMPRVAGLLRHWDSPIPVGEGLVERSWLGFGAQVGLPVAGVAGFGAAYYRLLHKRFPRASSIFVGTAAVVGGASYIGSIYVGGYAPYGVGMWQALANPVAPLGSNLGIDKRRG